MQKILLGTIIVLVLAFSYSEANAISLGSLVTGTANKPAQLIGIQLSQVCLTEIKNHDYSSCPSYQTLAKYDNTYHSLYGKFVDTNGWYHRDNPRIPNYYQVYNPGKAVIAVDPEENFILNAQNIIIQPKNFTYINVNDVVGNNHTRIEYHDRYNNQCKEEWISYSDFLLNDTIKYLQSGCTKTNFVDHKLIQTGNQPFDMVHSQALKNMAYYKTAKTRTQNCITQVCPYIDTGKKW